MPNMPNGKGFIDCSYCVYWRGLPRPYSPDTGPGVCVWHRMRIPEFEPGAHRLCRLFKPTTEYRSLITTYVSPSGHVHHRPLAQRLNDFGFLAFGYLYTFCYNNPPGRKRVMRLTDRLRNNKWLRTPAAPPVLSGVTGSTGVVGAFLGFIYRRRD